MVDSSDVQTAASKISKGNIQEMKSLASPPQAVKDVMSLVMIAMGNNTDWRSC